MARSLGVGLGVGAAQKRLPFIHIQERRKEAAKVTLPAFQLWAVSERHSSIDTVHWLVALDLISAFSSDFSFCLENYF